MSNVFRLFFKTKGAKSTLGTPTTYYNKVAELEVDNMEELITSSTEIANDLGYPINNFDVDVPNSGVPYKNVIKTDDKLENYNTNATR